MIGYPERGSHITLDVRVFKRFVQGMHANTQIEVEHVRPELDEHVRVACSADRQCRPFAVSRIDVQDGAFRARPADGVSLRPVRSHAEVLDIMLVPVARAQGLRRA